MSDVLTVIKEQVGERSRCRICVEVKDLEGNIVIPDTLKWTLTDQAGNVINQRSQVEVANPQASHPIFIFADDLAVTENSSTVTRILLIEATYTESGIPDMPYKHESKFEVKNFIGVGNE